MPAINAHYIWIIISIVSTAVYFVWSSSFLKKYPQVGVHFFVGTTHALAALLIMFMLDVKAVAAAMSYEVWRNVLVVALLTWLAKLLYYYAYSKTAVANVTIFSALTPVYAALLAAAMGAPLATHAIIGIALSSLGVMLFFYKKTRFDIGCAKLPVICAFLSTLPTALSIYFQKEAILASNVYYVSFIICVFAAMASFSLYVFSPKPVAMKHVPWRDVAGIGILQTVAVIAFSAFMVEGHPAVGQSLQRLSMFLQIVLAYLFLRERLDTKRHLLCVSLSLVGIFIMFWPGR